MPEQLEAVVARIDEGVKHIDKKVDALTKVATARLNSHSDDIRSLQATRSRQRGGAAVLSFLLVTGGAILSYIKMK